MSDIKIGEYVRTKLGTIAKIEDVEFDIKFRIDTGKPIYRNWKEDFGGSYVLNEEIIKHSPNIIDLIEDEDIVILEYKTPRYQERITRKFEISKIEEYINFENKHCSFWCKVGDKKIVDNICENIKIKTIVTKEQFKNVMYEV